MFDLGFAELMVIGITALIVVGPKDLPVLFQRAGEFVGKMRGMAREFSRAMDSAADESGMKGTMSDLKALSNPAATAMDSVRDAAKSAMDFNPDISPSALLDPESETGKLAAERKAYSAKIQAKTARATAERIEKEAAQARAKAEELEAKAAEAEAPPAEPKAAPKQKATAPKKKKATKSE